MTVVVTGAAGHLGANLVRALLAQKRPVRALVHHGQRSLVGLDVEIVQGDILDPASLHRALEGAEVVYHAAAQISLLPHEQPLLEATNVVGTRHVVEACLYCGVHRLVHFSSIHALVQEPLDIPVDESRPLAEARRHAPYDRSKAAGEKEVRKGIAQGLDAIILNPTAMIGPYDYRPSHFGEVLLSLSQRRLLALVEGGFDWVDVRDVVQGALRAEKRAPIGARYLLSGHWVSLRDLATTVEEITQVRAPWFVCPMWLARPVAPLATLLARTTGKRPLFTSVSLDVLRSNHEINHQRASRDLDYHPRAFRDTIADTFQWFEENGHSGAMTSQ